jgi:hypothetical protein
MSLRKHCVSKTRINIDSRAMQGFFASREVNKKVRRKKGKDEEKVSGDLVQL